MNDFCTAAEAARLRADGGVRQHSHRPSQRRCAMEESTGRNIVRMPAQMSVRASASDGGPLIFSGVASATEREYEMFDAYGSYSEVVSASAFDVTLARAGLDVPLVLAHDQIRRIARTTVGTLRLSMSDEGLAVEADLDPEDTDVAYVARKIKARLIDEMSFAFRIVSGIWAPEFDQYRITEVDLHRGDVAIVGWGANPHTSADLRAAPSDAPRRDYRERLASLLDLAIAN